LVTSTDAQKLDYWYRYVDATFMAWLHGMEEFWRFQTSQQHPFKQRELAADP
jgi:hypothetical protein